MGGTARHFYVSAKRKYGRVSAALLALAACLFVLSACRAADEWFLACGAMLLGVMTWYVSARCRLIGVEIADDGVVIVPYRGGSRRFGWADVRGCTAGWGHTLVHLGAGTGSKTLNLETEFAERERMAILRAVQLRVRRRGAGCSEVAVDGVQISRWLGVRPGQRQSAYSAFGRWFGEVTASDVGLEVIVEGRRHYVPWADLRDLELLPRRFKVARKWRVSHRGGSFLLGADWINVAVVADSIEKALAEQAVGHQLPGPVGQGVPSAAISRADGGQDVADRGLSLSDEG